MRRSRAVALTALGSAALLVLAACGGSGSTTTTTATSAATSGAQPGGEGGSPAPSAGGAITYAYEQEWYDYNASSSSGNATANQIVLNQVLRGFSYVDNTGTIQRDTEFGTFEKTSDDPLTVEYTFNDDAVWSDGEPIGCADFLLVWAQASGRYNADRTINEPGNPPAEPQYLFQTASTNGIDQTQKPDCNDGDKTVTLVYNEPFVDWQAALATSVAGSILPAHVAAREAGTTTAAFVDAIKNDNFDVLAPVAEFWNNGWTLDQAAGLPAAAIIPSSGPYLVSAWDPGQSVTLSKNPNWWGTPGSIDTLVIRYISQDQQVAALASGEVDVIEPQPNPDITAALNNLGASVNKEFGSQFTWEHMDLSVKNGFANEKLREALFKCAPRQQIVDNLIVPANPEAQLLNSVTTMDFQPDYAEVAAASGFEDFAQVDIEGAKAAYAASGEAQGKQIRVIHIDPNPRRTDEVALLKASCDPVGFNIQDVPLSSDQFGPTLSAGDYDIALFAWAGSGLNGSLPSIYLSTGSQNYSGWNDPQIDEAANAIATTTDPSQVTPLLIQLEQGLSRNMYTFPIFTFPGVIAWKTTITGPTLNAGQTQGTWNMQTWTRSG